MHQKSKSRLIDFLDDRSLEVLKNFGHVFTDPVTGKRRIRPYAHPKTVIMPRQAGKTTIAKVLTEEVLNEGITTLHGKPNRNDQRVSG